MAENPASWNEAIKTIYQAMVEFDEKMKNDEYGYSIYAYIYHKLREKGLIE